MTEATITRQQLIEALNADLSREYQAIMCSTCYTLKRQDTEYFGGLREVVLERDGYRCRVCDASGRGKREIIVHHRVPGKSVLNLMISLCPGCHAMIHRTKAALAIMPPLLLELWREQHPAGHEQLPVWFREAQRSRKFSAKARYRSAGLQASVAG